MLIRVIQLSTLLLMLSACSAPNVKPEEANLIEAAVNISSGEFDNQLSREKLKLKTSQDVLNAEADKNLSLNKQLKSLEKQKLILDRQLVLLRVENNRLKQQANQNLALSGIKKIEYDRQTLKIKNLNASISKLKRQRASSAGNKKYQTKITTLQQEIVVLRKMIINQ